MQANFYEKTLFVKADLVAPWGRAQQLGPSRYASIRTLGELTHSFGGSVHMMRSVFSGYQGGAAIFLAVSPQEKRVDQVRNLRSRPAGSEAMDH